MSFMDVHVKNEQLKILEGACVGDKASHIIFFEVILLEIVCPFFSK